MPYLAAAILSLIFIAIGFQVTVKNAKTILSGYNTMDEKEREHVDLPGFIRFFRRFNVFIGATTFIVFVILTQAFNSVVAGVTLVLYPLLGYAVAMWRSRRFYSGPLVARARWSSYLMIIPILAVTLGLWAGLKNDGIALSDHSLNIKGVYDESLDLRTIASMTLVKHLPAINTRSNGFSLGEVRKGYFKTEDGNTIKLVINQKQGCYILFTRSDGLRIYFSDRKENNAVLFLRLKTLWALNGNHPR